VTTLTLGSPLGGWADRVRRHPHFSLRVRLAVVGLAIAAAYHYSLLTLVRSLELETPLAYLGLVPFMAAGLAALRARPRAGEPAIHDRQVDYIIGIPLLLGAVAVITFMPARLSTLFWIWRVDLLSLPIFVAGVVTIVFGVRTLWRVRLAVGFLFLAWPLPYTLFLTRWLDGFTGVTISSLKKALGVFHVAEWTPGSDGSLFAITHGSERFVVSVASACSGVNGVVGFLLVGIAFTALVKGRRIPKLLWLTTGLALIWALNLGRLLLLFWVGRTWGESVAIDGLHPVIGLVLFCLGIVAMLAMMPLFRLSIAPPEPKTATVRAAHRPAVERVRLCLAIVTGVALFMGVANAGMRSYELVAGDLGAARLQSFTDSPAVVNGFRVTPTANYPWARRFFGEQSNWQRYSYFPSGTAQGLSGGSTIIADVITTDELGRFSAYGIEACYAFHGYDLRNTSTFDLGGGVTGNAITYYNPKQKLEWNAVYWIWPVKQGAKTVFERVVMLMPGTAQVQLLAAAPAPKTDLVRGIGLNVYSATKGGKGDGASDNGAKARGYLVEFSRRLVASRSAATAQAAPGGAQATTER
jgi:exosortase/archaeosortase family protein